ncbi:MAG: hypothetical protein PVG92_00770 [Holophagae bacterium]
MAVVVSRLLHGYSLMGLEVSAVAFDGGSHWILAVADASAMLVR